MTQLTDRIRVPQSSFFATNTGIVTGVAGSLLIDPGILPDELHHIADIAAPVAAGFCTHAHWDHVLWHTRFGENTPRFAYMETVINMRANRERILHILANGAEKWGIDATFDLDVLFQEQPLSQGDVSIAGIACMVVPIPGHESGQSALVLPEDKVAFVADTLSDIETPSFYEGSDSVVDYLTSLDQLQRIIDRVDWIVPGHGAPADRAEAQRRLDADRRYLEAIGPFVAAQKTKNSEDIARALLAELNDSRGADGLAWQMHLHNVTQILAEQGSAE